MSKTPKNSASTTGNALLHLIALPLLAFLSIGSSAHAAVWGVDVIYDLTSSGTGTEAGAGNGNAWNYSIEGIDMQLNAWSDLGTSNNTFQQAEAYGQANGMGVCNDEEDGLFFGFIPYTCGSFLDFNEINRQADNNGQRDWVLLYFSEQVLFQNVQLTPLGTRDMDITFRVGNIVSNDLTGLDYASINDGSAGFTGRHNRYTDPVNTNISYDLTATGAANAILIGGMFEETDDAFLLSEITVQAVPLPASFWLLLSAIGGIFSAMRRRQKSSAAIS